MAWDVLTSSVRTDLAKAAGSVENALLDHLDSEGIFPDSRAACSFLSSERDRWLQHMLDAAADFEVESFEDYADGQDEDAEHERSAAL